MPIRRLTRPRQQGKIAGVCAGLAEYFDVDVVLIRVLWVILSILLILSGSLLVSSFFSVPFAVSSHQRRSTSIRTSIRSRSGPL